MCGLKMKDKIGDRIKNNYENRYRNKLTRRTPVIMRLDGKAFHTFTRGMEKPFDARFRGTMGVTALALLREIQGAQCAYVQSDEISILITDYDKFKTDAWFDYNIQKMCSVSASIASVVFSANIGERAYFDCRVFNIPKEEVGNYFIWRYKDWVRNSLSMFAQSFFSQKQLNGKRKADMHEMLHEKGQNWAKLLPIERNGRFIIKDGTSNSKKMEDNIKTINMLLEPTEK